MRGRTFVHDGAQLRRGRVNHGGRPGDFDNVGRAADHQCDVHGDNFVQVEWNSFAHVFFKALARGVNFVGAHGDLEENIFAISAGLHLAGGVSGLVDQRNGGADHRSAGRVDNRTAKASARALRVRKRNEENNPENHGK